MLATFVYRGPIRHRDSPLLRWAQAAYEPSLQLGHAARPCSSCSASLVALGRRGRRAVAAGSEFLPELNEGSLYLTFTLPANISLNEGRRLVPQITEIIERDPEVAVRAVAARTPGRRHRSDAGQQPRVLRPTEAAGAVAASAAHAVRRDRPLNRGLSEIPGLEVNFSQPIRDNVNENISGQFGQIAVKFYGDDLGAAAGPCRADRRRPSPRSLAWPISASSRAARSRSSKSSRIARRSDAMASTWRDFQHAIQAALGGQPVGVFWDGETRHDIVLRYPPSARDESEKIRKLQVAVAGRDHRADRNAGAGHPSAAAAPRSAAKTGIAISASV